ncbi:hypothetical protein [Hyphococcus sp.]
MKLTHIASLILLMAPSPSKAEAFDRTQEALDVLERVDSGAASMLDFEAIHVDDVQAIYSKFDDTGFKVTPISSDRKLALISELESSNIWWHYGDGGVIHIRFKTSRFDLLPLGYSIAGLRLNFSPDDCGGTNSVSFWISPKEAAIIGNGTEYVARTNLIYPEDDTDGMGCLTITDVILANWQITEALPNSRPMIQSRYYIQTAHNDELFVINDEVFSAQTFCFDMEAGDEVVFVSGSPLGACASAELLNVRTKKICKVWCE